MRRDSPQWFGIEKKQAIRPVLLRRSERPNTPITVSGATFAHSWRPWTIGCDLNQERDLCQKYPLYKETFF